MKKKLHLSKSLDDMKQNQYPPQINTFRKEDPHKNFPTIIPKNIKTNGNTQASSFILFPEQKNYFLNKSFSRGVPFPKPNFLEEMYLKYSKNLQKYFLTNQTGLKLAGNKYFKNLTVEDYMKQNNLTQEEFIYLLNGVRPPSIPLKNYEKEISKENFFLTPMPNKSRELLKTNKEKNDFLEAERSAVVMRTFEYTHKIKSKVGMRELKKILEEQKQRMINLMLVSASKIQRWWKKKYYIINKNKSNENYEKKMFYYNYMLNKKKAKIFLDKIKQLFKKKKKTKFNFFISKLNSKAKNSIKKFFSIFDWVNNIKICSNINFNILRQNFPLIKKNSDFIHNFFITKIKIATIQNNNSQNDINVHSELYQIQKIIFIQKMFRHYLRIKKGKQLTKIYTNSQFDYISPNKIAFFYNKNINSDKKKIKMIAKNNYNYYYNPYNQNNKKKGHLPNLSPISKNINENYDDLDNDNTNNKDIILLKNTQLDNDNNKNNKNRNRNEKNTRNNDVMLKGYKSEGNYNIEFRSKSNIYDKMNKKNNTKNIPNKKTFNNKQNIKRNNNEPNIKNKKQINLLFQTKSNKNFNTNKNKISKIESKYKINYPQMKKIPKNNLLKNNLLKIEENELSLISTTNNNINNNPSQNNHLILIDSLEIEKEKPDKKITINNNEDIEYLENSIPPELNIDNYQQDSILDLRDKRIKSNQKTISTSAILHLDTSDNHIFLNNQNYHDSYPLQILGQICLNYIHRPLISGNNCYFQKINKKNFSSDIKIALNKIINIKNNFSFEKQLSLNSTNFLKKYLKKWKYITNKMSPPFIYSKIITSICTAENSEKNNFSYYCRINKSNQENDFMLLRISLGYKLLKKIFCFRSYKKFLYLLKRRRRRNFRAKTYNYGDYSKNVFHLLEFKIKLPVVLNKIMIKKYFGIFFHKFLIFSMKLDKTKKLNMNDNNNCKLIVEGYRKGYFKIMYNILQIKLNYKYFNTGLKLSTFFEEILNLNI